MELLESSSSRVFWILFSIAPFDSFILCSFGRKSWHFDRSSSLFVLLAAYFRCSRYGFKEFEEKGPEEDELGDLNDENKQW